MKSKLIQLLLLPLAVLLVMGLEEKPKTHIVKVMHCHDGDTCTVKIADSIWFSVRLFGVDSPEVKNKRMKTSQPIGEEARDFLNQMVKDKEVTLRQADIDPYNRPVVEMIINDKVVNLMLVEKGFAEAYKGKTKRFDKAPYQASEDAAKKAKIGIWSLTNYISPGDFRKSMKK
jgi:micrococcal nuclease